MKYNSGRVKKFDQTGITSDRYEFLGLEQAEPDLGDPLVGVSSIGAKPIPANTEYDHYVPIAVGSQPGSRYWIKSQNLITQGIQGTQGVLSNFQGTQGSQGRQGSQGLQGVQGLQGQISNFQGTQGNQGLSNQGSQGTQGFQGAQGIQGNQGVQATQGTQGLLGRQGSQGNQGTQGTISNFQGTQGNQGLSNQGSQGSQGSQGTQGNQGLSNQGSQGTQGNQGNQGLQGAEIQGSQGLQGVGTQGNQGLQGANAGQGTQGNQGTQGLGSQGSQGLQGAGWQGTQGSQGFQGRQGIQGLQGLQGPAGSTQGTQGIQGLQGLQGPAGTSQGTQGSQGLQVQGTQGLSNQGTQGTQGFSGNQGNQGSQGVQGLSGLLGNQGAQGTQGSQGRQGIQGLSNQGSQGTQGTIGSQGFQGLQGLQGSGTQGSQGIQGLQGTGLQGNQGLQGGGGTQGAQGLQGRQGIQGLSGTGNQGAQGAQGVQGFSGSQGFQGLQGKSGVGGGNSSCALIDLAVSNTLTLGTGTRITTPSSVTFMSSRTEVPSTTTSIGVFGTSSAPTPSGSRILQNQYKTYLTSVEFVYFYVNKATTWGDIPQSGYDLFLEYSIDGSNWSTLAQVQANTITSTNSWTLISQRVPAGAKYYNGVYLRFYQYSYYYSDDNWAFTSVIPEFGTAGGSSTTSGSGGNLMIAAMNFADQSLFTIGSGVVLTTCSAYGTSSSTEVPSNTSIVVFRGTSDRVITNYSRIYLTTVNSISFYVNKALGWGDEPDNYQFDDLYVQYSTDGSNYITFPTGNLPNGGRIRPVDIASGNVWTPVTVTVPDTAKYYNGVYLRVLQSNYYYNDDNWAITSLIASSGSSTNVNDPSSSGNLTVSLMNFSNTLTLTLGDGVRMSSVGAYYATMSTLTNKVPSGTLIGIFDGYISENQNGSRIVQNKTKVYLTTLDYIWFYFNIGGSGWGDQPEYYQFDYLYVQYSTDGTNWITFADGTINPLNVSLNTWILKTIIIPDAAKSFSGVYLRFHQPTYYYGTDNWAFTTLVGGFGQPETTDTTSAGNLSLFLMNFYNSNTLTLSDGSTLSSVGSYTGITIPSNIPTGTPIIVFDGGLSLNGNGTRVVTNKEKVHLINVDFLNYYVNMGGSGWGDIPEYYQSENFYVQYSTNGSSWTDLDNINPITIPSSNVWYLRTLRVPDEAKNAVNGVYLQFYQPTYYYNTDNWAFTTLFPAFGAIGGDPNHTGSIDNVILNLRETENITVSDGTRIMTVGSSPYTLMSTSTAVPSGTTIGVFDGYISLYGNGTRNVKTYNKVYLNGISSLQFYVNKGGINWGDAPDNNTHYLVFEYSLDGSTGWTSFTGGTLNPASYSANVWTLVTVTVPAAAQRLNGVYVRFSQASYYYNYDNWAFTSVYSPFGSLSVSDDTTTNANRYILLSDTSSGNPNLTVSSSKLLFNPSVGILTATTVHDSAGNLRKLPNLAKSSSYTLAIGDVGDLVNITTGGVTVPSGVFSAGDAITIYNNSTSSQTITQGTSVTMYIAGTSTTGNRTLGGRGLCTVLCVASNEFVISGSGLS